MEVRTSIYSSLTSLQCHVEPQHFNKLKKLVVISWVNVFSPSFTEYYSIRRVRVYVSIIGETTVI